MVGSRLGPYEIFASLGKGGMGEVYRARDTRLDRDVAIKTLPRSFADDPERLARFEREARLLASLNHPSIAAIYGVEDVPSAAGGPPAKALVLELVEGPTLAERIRSGRLPIANALEIAAQIADALEAAHARGIVHRDLKPENVKLTADGAVKVLDFGLAKGREPSDAPAVTAAPTLAAMETRPGIVLGTAAYMSPEQARGQPVDRRTDVWAFGCVLYEMLAGSRPFDGDTITDILGRVLERDPDWSRVPERTPAGVRRLLRRCLQKDPRRRLRDIGDARLELDEALAPGSGEPAADVLASTRRRRTWLAVAGLAAGAGLLGFLAAERWPGHTRGAGVPITRATIVLPESQTLDTGAGQSPLALSPDGRRLAYVASSSGRAQLFIRELDRFDAKALAGTEGARYPFFSPDGQSVAFFAAGKLKRVSIQGGSPVTLCDVPGPGRGGTWGPEGTIVFDPGQSGLLRVDARGGEPQRLTTGDPGMDDRDLSWPQFLPDGRGLLATANAASVAGSTVVLLSLDGGGWTTLVPGSQASFVPSGHLVFHAPAVREGELQAVAFDADALATRGDPVSVLDGVFRAESAGGAYFAVSREGTLVFAAGGHARTLVRVDRIGRRTPLLSDRRGYRLPQLSPEGRRLAVTVDPRPSQIWIYDLERATGVPLATAGHSLGPIWTPDGRRVAYASGGEIYWRAPDGSSEAERLLTRERPQYPQAWTPDGRTLVFTDDHPATGYDIWVQAPGEELRPLLATPASEAHARLSDDGRWLAYTSDEAGRTDVYVRPFPNVGDGKWLVSRDGGVHPEWTADGRELFYVNGAALMRVAIDGRTAALAVGEPEVLFTGPFETGSPQFDVSPDGATFVMVEADPDAMPTNIHLVRSWIEELERLVPSSDRGSERDRTLERVRP